MDGIGALMPQASCPHYPLQNMASADDNLFDCNKPNLWIPYFLDAEADMETQWTKQIWPEIEGFDFTTVVELSPGGGRNTKRLMKHAGEIHLVDFNQYAITLCKFRFMDYEGACRLNYHVNDGKSLAAIPDGTATCCYSWDSAVHFDRDIVCAYIREFARVLKPGGKVFLHHSNLGDRGSVRIRENPHWRSNMSAALARQTAEQAGLVVEHQTLFNWGEPDLDCISIFRKA
jgi:ubiquinone/menaquinone biosynthesis C-methylase UbiE